MTFVKISYIKSISAFRASSGSIHRCNIIKNIRWYKLLCYVWIIIIPTISHAQFGAGVGQYTAYNAIKWGVLVNSDVLSNDQKSDITKDTLGCLWARTAIVSTQWNGSSSRFEIYDDKDILQAVNVSYYANNSGQAFLTGTLLNDFVDTVQLIVNKYPQMGWFVLLNEEMNQTYHSGPITDYCKMLQAVYPIVHAAGIQMADGGVFGTGLDIDVYRWLVTKYNQSAADAYGQQCMSNAQVNAAKTPGSNPTLDLAARKVDTVLMYKAYVDAFNIHVYEPLSRTTTQPDTVTQAAPVVVRYQIEYIKDITNKPVIDNEDGIRDNNQPTLVTSMLTQYYRLGIPLLMFFNGEGSGGSQPLTDPTTGAILATGTAWRTYIIAHQSKNWGAPN